MAVKALLLCAGLGTRLRPYTNLLPKPAIPFFGIPLSFYSLYLLKKVGCKDITVNLHHLPEKMHTLFKHNEVSDFCFSYSLEKDQIMGSGGALYYAQNHLKDASSFFAINSDEVMIPPNPSVLEDLKNHHLKTQSLVTLLVTDHPELMKTLKPVWVNKEGLVRGFGAKPETTESLHPVHYTGYKIFSKEILPLLPAGESHIFHDTVVPAMKNGAIVNTLFIDCKWWETGSFANLLNATADVIRLVQQNPKNHIRDVYDSFHREFAFSLTSDSQKNIAIHKTSPISSSQCQGTVFVDSHSFMPSGTTLQDCIIDKDLQLSQSEKNIMILNTEAQ